MNAINVVQKTVVVMPARTAEINALTWRTLDDPFRRRLQIMVNNMSPILIEGDEYDALGQWTDDAMKKLVITRLELIEAV